MINCFKRVLSIVCLCALVLTLASCAWLFEDEPVNLETDETWAIYWYLCGSDLETEYGAATADLEEMMEVSLPDNVNVIIQTGGAAEWQNFDVEAGVIGRYLYSSAGFEMIEQLPDANMGQTDTLVDFLSYCSQSYPADHVMVLFWNHGGGSVSGVAFDELHDFDSLTLSEMYSALGQVYGAPDQPPLEVVGFDACLMATVDTAKAFSDFSRYLIASEETEPGCGWHYSGWLDSLTQRPDMDGAELGKIICDSYVEGCELADAADDITLSVVDLQKIAPLIAAYDNLGKEALTLACSDPTFFSRFGRTAIRSENYGGNTPDAGYTNMVDLGHLVRNSEQLLPETSQPLLDALEQCVVYRVNGPYREESTGLSCYYSYSGDVDELAGYVQVAASDAFKYLYGYELSGQLDEEGMRYIDDIGYAELPGIPNGSDSGLENYPVEVSEDGCAVLDLGAEIANVLKGVYFELYYMHEEEDLILLLGRDNDLNMDWDNGVFYDNFRGTWGAIDGYFCYMELIYEGESYNLYTVPILLNGKEYHLRVVYDYSLEEYAILGARKGIEDTGMADKNLIQLQPGDEITTIHYIMSASDDSEDVYQVEIDTFVVTENTSFAEESLGEGSFAMMFEMVDAANASYYSDIVMFTVEDGEIYVG